MASNHDSLSQPEIMALASDQFCLHQASLAKLHNLPPIGSKAMSKHGIEWEIINYDFFPLPAGLSKTPYQSDCLPLVWPTKMSERLAQFINETDHCTSKHILFIDTMPAAHLLKLGENLHYAICSSNPDESYILLDTANAHETTFAHEIAHLWLNYVQEGGDGMRRLCEAAWDNAKYMQLNFVQSFVVDLKVNDLIAGRGFDMSLITDDNIQALASFKDAITLGYKPPTSREALLHSLAIADAILEQKRWPDDEKMRLVGLLDFFEAATPQVYRTAEELVAIVRKHGYDSGEAIRKTLDECITLAFQATDDDFDIARDLEEAPLVEGLKDKFPQEFPGFPVSFKLEIGKTMSRNGIKVPCNIWVGADDHGMAQIVTEGGKGPFPVNYRLTSPQHMLPNMSQLPQRKPMVGGKNPDTYECLPGKSGYNTAYPPDHDFLRPLQPISPISPPMYQAGLAHYMAGVALNVARARLMQQQAKNGGLDANAYQYAYNNPVSYIDPDGLEPTLSDGAESVSYVKTVPCPDQNPGPGDFAIACTNSRTSRISGTFTLPTLCSVPSPYDYINFYLSMGGIEGGVSFSRVHNGWNAFLNTANHGQQNIPMQLGAGQTVQMSLTRSGSGVVTFAINGVNLHGLAKIPLSTARFVNASQSFNQNCSATHSAATWSNISAGGGIQGEAFTKGAEQIISNNFSSKLRNATLPCDKSQFQK